MLAERPWSVWNLYHHDHCLNLNAYHARPFELYAAQFMMKLQKINMRQNELSWIQILGTFLEYCELKRMEI